MSEVNDLVPMTYDDIAVEMGVYRSTISRIVNNKYLLCSKGLFPFRYFFSKAITNMEGDDISNRSVKAMISELVEEENKAKPLTDQEISNLINEKGIIISRRTIAKYREELNIPSTRGRKRV